jgi:uncharacterized peroxidase-related enzyme
MPFFPSLLEDAGVRHILALHPTAGRSLIELHEAVLRTDSQLRAKDKELIAAYVSGLNDCRYCFGVHEQTALAFGISPGALGALLTDIETAPVDSKLKPILRYARTLTLEPSKMTQRLAVAVFEAGWTERDLHDAVLTISLFNFMNRLVEGHGVKGAAGIFLERGQALKELGYSPLLAALSDLPEPDR